MGENLDRVILQFNNFASVVFELHFSRTGSPYVLFLWSSLASRF